MLSRKCADCPAGMYLTCELVRQWRAGTDEYVTRRLGSDPDFNNPSITVALRRRDEWLQDQDTVEHGKAYSRVLSNRLYQGAEFYLCIGHRRQRENNHIRNLAKRTWRLAYRRFVGNQKPTVRKRAKVKPEALARLDGARLAVTQGFSEQAQNGTVGWLKQITGRGYHYGPLNE